MSLPRICATGPTARLATAALLAVALFAISAARATAGTYVIGDCPDAFTRTTSAGPWQFFGPSAGAIITPECSPSTESSLFFAVQELPTTPMGFFATTDGTNLSIVNARLWWRAYGSPSGEVEAEMLASYAPDQYLTVNSWQGSGILVDDMGTPEEFSYAPSEAAKTLTLTEHCLTANTCQMTESYGLGVQLFGSEITLEDDVPPTSAITSFQHEDRPAVSGPVQTAFTATDADAGIKMAELLVDGAPVATHDYGSSCSFTELRACPGALSDTLDFAGASVPEGTHQVAVRVSDAAGNTAISASQTLTTSHTPRPPHIPNGVPCASPTITLSAHRHQHQVTIPLGHAIVIEGRLRCATTPVPGARIALGITTTAGVAIPNPPAVTTAGDGTFRIRAAPGPSRKLAFSYRAYSDESAPAARGTLQINVTPKIALHIRPRRTHNNGAITWRGRIERGPYPPAGMPLLVQVKEGKRWQTFDELVARQGKFGYRYTFHRTTRATTYTFRIALPAGGDVGYPYAFAASRPIKVAVG